MSACASVSLRHLSCSQVEFPAKPSVSAEAKEFIRKCLALRAANRWDVATAAADPYLSGGKKGNNGAAASNA